VPSHTLDGRRRPGLAQPMRSMHPPWAAPTGFRCAEAHPTLAMVGRGAGGTAEPVATQPGTTYRVTVTNLTQHQIFSFPIVATHRVDGAIFHAGGTVDQPFWLMAEDGIAADLAAKLDADPRVYDVAVAPELLMPGHSVTLTVEARPPFVRLSAVGMLVPPLTPFTRFRALCDQRPCQRSGSRPSRCQNVQEAREGGDHGTERAVGDGVVASELRVSRPLEEPDVVEVTDRPCGKDRHHAPERPPGDSR